MSHRNQIRSSYRVQSYNWVKGEPLLNCYRRIVVSECTCVSYVFLLSGLRHIVHLKQDFYFNTYQQLTKFTLFIYLASPN